MIEEIVLLCAPMQCPEMKVHLCVSEWRHFVGYMTWDGLNKPGTSFN